MKERPILFSGVLIRTLLAGRKTQTRRPVALQPCENHLGMYGDRYNKSAQWAFWMSDHRMLEPRTFPCPYSDIGDRLWVREAFRVIRDDKGFGLHYRADSQLARYWPNYDRGKVRDIDAFALKHANTGKTIPSIHMPAWASRITLEITDVRLQHLQDITEEDASAEGVLVPVTPERKILIDLMNPILEMEEWEKRPFRCNFAGLWDSVYGGLNLKGTHGWDANPWVWVVAFKRAESEVATHAA